MDITHCTLKYIFEHESNATRYLQSRSHGPSIRLSASHFAVGHQINIQCYNKTLFCLLETGDTRFPTSTNSSSYIRACASVL